MTQQQLLYKIRAHAFALVDLNLYLDTHPCDVAALEKLAECRAEKARLIGEYEAQYGPYVLTTHDVENTCCWSWLNSPWPWDYERGE